MADKVVLLDGNSLANRAFYGISALSDGSGRYTNAVYGFCSILFKLLEEEAPTHLAAAFDLHEPTFRHKLYQEYKGTRKGMPEELRQQMPLLKEVLQAMQISIFELGGFEADDILGTLAKKAEADGLLPVVISGDRDMLQLCSDTIQVRIPKTKMGKTEVENYFAQDVIAKYGVTPTEFIEMKALMGDASDNIPGVPGIGEKTASKIIQQFHTVENAIANWEQVTPKKASANLQEFQEQARLSKTLAEINCHVPLAFHWEELCLKNIYNATVYDLFKQLDFKSFLTHFSLQEEPVESKSYERLDSLEGFQEFRSRLTEEETAFALYAENGILQSISFYNNSIGGVCLCVKTGVPKDWLEVFRDYFEEEKYRKIAHGLKQNKKILHGYGINCNGVFFDTEIAGYLLNPLRSTYAYEDLAGEFLLEQYPSEEELLGKGKSKVSLFSLPEQEQTQFLSRQVEIFFRAYEKMKEQMEQNQQQVLFYEIEMPLIEILYQMEQCGIQIDREGLLAYQARLDNQLEGMEQEIYLLAGEEFNINSPKQLGVILFERLGLKGSKKTKTGYSTAADVLEKLKGEAPIIDHLLLYRQLMKLKSTYADGLLAVAEPKTDKIHSTFHQTITATGRISSAEPNLQNIPIRLELGRELRKVFIPSSKECIFLDADYSQIELRVLAHMTQDETLIHAFQTGQDIHRLTASQVFNIPFEEVTSQQRSHAKAVNFGIVYGIGAFSLSQDLGISVGEAEEYMSGYFKKYPNIKDYMDITIAQAKKDGFVSTLYGRRRPIPELSSSNFNQRAFGQRVAMNMPIQGTAADIIKIAMIKVHQCLQEGNFRSRIILQVHDELLLETYKEEAEPVSQLLVTNMEQAVALSVPLRVDVHSGDTWYETK